MENEVSGSARPCEDLLSFEVKLKVNYSRGRALPLPDPPQASKPMTPIKPFARFVWVVNMAEWRRYAAIQKAKRKGKKTGEESTVAEEIVVQRMSADVSGKQQKYTRIGPQEYVPFEHEEITIANIKDACKKHFRPQIEKNLICDVLAGERGPSCEKMAHIPNRKVFYIRFIKREGVEVVSDEDGSLECKVIAQ